MPTQPIRTLPQWPGCRPVLLALAMLNSPLTMAHEANHPTLSSGCQQPIRPADHVAPAVWRKFLADVDTFRDCTHRAMEQHQNEAAMHQNAARLAVDEWNLFVRHSLNAPKDFPHESQQPARPINDAGHAETSGGYMGTDPSAELRPQFAAPERDTARLTIRRKGVPAEPQRR